MLGFLKKLFGTKPTVNPCPEAPYKVEVPTPVAEKATEAMVESVKPAPTKKAPAKKAAPKKEAAAKKPGRKPKSKA